VRGGTPVIRFPRALIRLDQNGSIGPVYQHILSLLD